MAKNTQVIKGKAWWAKIMMPDKEYNNFNIEILMEERSEQEKFKAEVMAEIDKKVDQHTEGKKKPKVEHYPWKVVEDGDGMETGDLRFKFGMKKSFVTRDGETIEQHPQCFDSKGNLITDKSFKIGNGSVVKVSFFMAPYYNKGKAGVSLRLKAVQIIDLVHYGVQQNPTDFGFSEEKEGFAYDPEAMERALESEAVDGDF